MAKLNFQKSLLKPSILIWSIDAQETLINIISVKNSWLFAETN